MRHSRRASRPTVASVAASGETTAARTAVLCLPRIHSVSGLFGTAYALVGADDAARKKMRKAAIRDRAVIGFTVLCLLHSTEFGRDEMVRSIFTRPGRPNRLALL